MLTVFGALAELERENTLQRQKEGIDAEKKRGVHFGRPNIEKPKEFEKIYTECKLGSIKAVQAFNLLNLKKTTFYKIAKQHEKIIK